MNYLIEQCSNEHERLLKSLWNTNGLSVTLFVKSNTPAFSCKQNNTPAIYEAELRIQKSNCALSVFPYLDKQYSQRNSALPTMNPLFSIRPVLPTTPMIHNERAFTTVIDGHTEFVVIEMETFAF